MATNDAVERFRAVPRLRLANLDSPLERLDRLRSEIPGAPHLYIKRDDCLGYLVGGNKLRKLEYVMADVRRKQATTVLTVGSLQSNHARITAMLARRLGLECVLILNGTEPAEPRANYRIDKLLGVEIHLVENRAQRNVVMAEVARDLEQKGKRVYQVPLGASDAVGAFGFVAALEEVTEQAAKLGVGFDAIVVSSSSGGTQAGLEVGKRLFQRNDLQIIGVSPDDSAKDIKGYALKAMQPMLDQLGLGTRAEPTELCVDDEHFGEGYRITTPASHAAAGRFMQTEGILLDPVYTAKAAAALIDYCQQKRFRTEQHVLFWHTGGLLALFE